MAKLTEEQERKIHEALEMSDGSVAEAAKLLDIDNKVLHNTIASNKTLKARWGAEAVNPPVDTIHREVPEPPEDVALLHDQEVAKQLAQEDAAVKRGLEKMGVKGDILDLSVAFRDFSRKHFSSAFDVVSGGITRQYMDVVAEIVSIDEDLKAMAMQDKHEINDCAREIMLREDRARLLDFSVKLYDRTLKAALIAARIRAMKQERDKGGDAPKGFLRLKKVK